MKEQYIRLDAGGEFMVDHVNAKDINVLVERPFGKTATLAAVALIDRTQPGNRDYFELSTKLVRNMFSQLGSFS